MQKNDLAWTAIGSKNSKITISAAKRTEKAVKLHIKGFTETWEWLLFVGRMNPEGVGAQWASGREHCTLEGRVTMVTGENTGERFQWPIWGIQNLPAVLTTSVSVMEDHKDLFIMYVGKGRMTRSNVFWEDGYIIRQGMAEHSGCRHSGQCGWYCQWLVHTGETLFLISQPDKVLNANERSTN